MDEEQKRLAEELLFAEKKQKSFAKLLFFGEIDSAKVFPYPKPTSREKKEVDQYLSELKAFTEKSIDPDWIDRHADIPQEVIQGLAKLGMLSLTIPTEYGGKGMSQYAYCRAMEIIASRCGSTALFINAHQSVGLKALLLFGTKEQKEKWLVKLGKGEAIAAFSLTEKGAGSDAAGVQTRASYDPEKKMYRINGDKQWTTNGSIAQILTVMVRTKVQTPKGEEDKITAFLVTPDMPGFKVTAAALEKVGYRGTKTTNLSFENVEVPQANILGPMGGGLKVCLTVLDYGRVTFGATCTGIAKDVVAKTIDYAIHRYQFKRPLASFALVKRKLTRMSTLLYAMESTTYLTAGLVDQNCEDFMLEAAILKVFASDALWSILYDTMQIFGGRSFFTNLPFERIMRDIRINLIGEGSNEVLRAFIGLVGMRDVGEWLKDTKDLKQLKKTLKQSMRYFLKQKIPVQSKLLQKDALRLASAVRKFGRAVVHVLIHFREQVIEKQLVLDRIAEAAMALYTSFAVLARIDSDLQDQTAQENDLSVAKEYLRGAFLTIEQSLDNLFNTADESIEKLSDKLTKVHFP